MVSDSYRTITGSVEIELKVKGSRFIGHASPAKSKTAAEEYIAKIRKQHFDATHNCFAYRIGTEPDIIIRYSDDGEPSGTAGKPILQAIVGHDLTNIIVVVTRYFGGIKLGTGGLARAYRGAATTALKSAQIKQEYLTDRLCLEFPYECHNIVQKNIDKFNGRIANSDYGTSVLIELTLRRTSISAFKQQLIDQSGGKITIT